MNQLCVGACANQSSIESFVLFTDQLVQFDALFSELQRKCLNASSKISYSSVGNWADDVIELEN